MARNTEAMQRLARQHPDGAIECATVDVRDHRAVKAAAIERMVGRLGRHRRVHSECRAGDFLSAC